MKNVMQDKTWIFYNDVALYISIYDVFNGKLLKTTKQNLIYMYTSY